MSKLNAIYFIIGLSIYLKTQFKLKIL